MIPSNNHSRALQVSRALEIRKEEAITLENAKFTLLDSPNLDPDTIRVITNRYKAVDRLIKYLERKLTNLCAED